MGHNLGDAVRLRSGSDYRDLLGDEWCDLTATVREVDVGAERIAVVFPEPFPGFTSLLPAGEFVLDRALDAGPF